MNGRFISLIALLCALAGSARADVIYVDADSPGPVHDGTSWKNAYRTLEPALAEAIFFDEIQVAQGTYVPDPIGLQDPRNATFELPSAVAVRGGYAGFGEPDPDTRDVAAFRTILSGDLNGDDRTGGNNSDNCVNVLQANLLDFDSILDGFTITGGNANRPYDPPFFGLGRPGGGLWAAGFLDVRSCVFVENFATAGGGMFSFEGSPSLTNVTFVRNRAAFRGGGLALFGTDLPNPIAGGDGGVAHGTPQVVRCSFFDNWAGNAAGGAWVDGIAENPTFTDCVFRGNVTNQDGGALWNGGGFANLVNCLLFDNHAGDEGGAAYTDTLTSFFNCTIANNTAADGGGSYSAFFRPNLRNSILWGNRSDATDMQEAQASGGQPIPDHSCVEGWTGSWDPNGQFGGGNIGADPDFVPGPAGCYYLSSKAAGQAADSPCLDAANDTSVALQLDGRTTSTDEVVDFGTADMGYHYSVTGLALLAGDFDRNGLLDLRDVAAFQRCRSVFNAGGVTPCCRIFDSEPDGDVDLDDYVPLHRLVQQGLQGSGS